MTIAEKSLLTAAFDHQDLRGPNGIDVLNNGRHSNGRIASAGKPTDGAPSVNGHNLREPITIETGPTFILHGHHVEYRLRLDQATGTLVHEHFGAPVGHLHPHNPHLGEGWGMPLYDLSREWPDTGRGGDFRLPAILIRHADNSTISQWEYRGYNVVQGKQPSQLPATFGGDDEVSTLYIDLVDDYAGLNATLVYSIFPKHDAIARKTIISNKGSSTIDILRASSWSTDFGGEEWDMIQLSGDWGRECTPSRHKIHVGTQGFQSSCGISSAHFNPFVSIVRPETTEHSGDAWGFSLLYSGSHAVEIERFVHKKTRVMLGLNPLHASIPLEPGEDFETPECLACYSSEGIGGMSRLLHRMFRDHLCRSTWTYRERPVLLNVWEGTYFDFCGEDIRRRAESASELGIKLIVMDDGWFGRKYPRENEEQGLGDWMPNEKRFPGGLPRLIGDITAKVKFGLWVEPEMVSPKSELFEAHPDWVMQARGRPITPRRHQYILNLGKPEVQDFIIDAMSTIIRMGPITYIKWDHNRGMHEIPEPSAVHAHIKGLYRILDTLLTRFPRILFEGCASGGGRFDPGIYSFFPQSWASDNTDALERLTIQFGATMVYPASSLGCHVSIVPNEQVGRTTPLEFRAHVAMMGGSFGFEMDLNVIPKHEREMIPDIIQLAERINPYVIHGDQYRLALPDTNWPAVLYMWGTKGVLLAFQLRPVMRIDIPPTRFHGLHTDMVYSVDGVMYTGASLVHSGLRLDWGARGDYQSRVVWIEAVSTK